MTKHVYLKHVYLGRQVHSFVYYSLTLSILQEHEDCRLGPLDIHQALGCCLGIPVDDLALNIGRLTSI